MDNALFRLRSRFFLLSTVLLTLLYAVSLFADTEKYSVSIRYIGLPMTAVTFHTTTNDTIYTLSVQASSSGLAGALYSIDNLYTIMGIKKWQPLSYQKDIKQGDFSEQRIILFDIHHHMIHDRVCVSDSVYKDFSTPWDQTVTDLFSLLYKIRQDVSLRTRSDFCYANGEIWNATTAFEGYDYLKTKITEHKIKCARYSLTFSSCVPAVNSGRTDILTNNLFNTSKKLLFWFSDDEKRIPVKACFQRKPFNVLWYITEYSQE